MTNAQRLAVRLSEIRSKLNELSGSYGGKWCLDELSRAACLC